MALSFLLVSLNRPTDGVSAGYRGGVSGGKIDGEEFTAETHARIPHTDTRTYLKVQSETFNRAGGHGWGVAKQEQKRVALVANRETAGTSVTICANHSRPIGARCKRPGMEWPVRPTGPQTLHCPAQFMHSIRTIDLKRIYCRQAVWSNNNYCHKWPRSRSNRGLMAGPAKPELVGSGGAII